VPDPTAASRSTGPNRATEATETRCGAAPAQRYGCAVALPEHSDDPAVMGEPDPTGRFGRFGGRFVPETLMPALMELEQAFRDAWADGPFRSELDKLLCDYAGRPSALTECHRLSAELGVRVLLKREDLNHTGSHKINNVLGQALLAKRMGKARLVAETGAGQHGVATATAAALLGQECVVYMGEVDMARQELNVFRMRLLGAEVVPATSGSRTLKDAVNDAMRDWVATVERSHYCLGSVMGPHPYPWMVREFHRVTGTEARRQMLDATGSLPDVVVACVGGGSNAAGIFSGFSESRDVDLVGVEPAGGAAVGHGIPGIVHGRTSSARWKRPSRSPPVSTIPAWARSTVTWPIRVVPAMRRLPTTRWWRRSCCSAAPRESSRRWSRRMRSRGCHANELSWRARRCL